MWRSCLQPLQMQHHWTTQVTRYGEADSSRLADMDGVGQLRHWPFSSRLPRIGHVQVLFPVRTVTRELAVTGDGIPVVAECAGHPLREARRISPQPPDTVFQAHLIDPCHSSLIGIEHGTSFVRVIMADDTDRAWRTRGIPLKAPYEESIVDEPCERRTTVRCDWKERVGSHHVPFTNQDAELFERTGGLR